MNDTQPGQAGPWGPDPLFQQRASARLYPNGNRAAFAGSDGSWSAHDSDGIARASGPSGCTLAEAKAAADAALRELVPGVVLEDTDG